MPDLMQTGGRAREESTQNIFILCERLGVRIEPQE